MDRAVQKKLWWGLGTSSVALIALQTCNAGNLFNCGLCDRDKCHSLENRVLERKAPECDCRFGHFETEWTPWAANCPPASSAADCVNGQCARNPVIPQPGWSNSYLPEASAPQPPAPRYEYPQHSPYIHAPAPLPPGNTYHHQPQYPVHQDVPHNVPFDYPRVTDPGLPLSIPNQSSPIVSQPSPGIPEGNFSPMIPSAPTGTGSPNPMPHNSVPMNPMQGLPAPMNDIPPPTRSEIPGDVSMQRRMPVQPTGHWQNPNWQNPAGSWQNNTAPTQGDKWRVMPGYNGPQSQQPAMSRPFFLR